MAQIGSELASYWTVFEKGLPAIISPRGTVDSQASVVLTVRFVAADVFRFQLGVEPPLVPA